MESDSSVEAGWRHALAVTRPALLLAPRDLLREITERLGGSGIIEAVAEHDTASIYDWLVGLLARQGISNHAADVFIERNGSPTWAGLAANMARSARCPKLRSYWHYAGCGFRRDAATCSVPHHRLDCPVASLPARKGGLAVAAMGLFLFLRDLCDGDFIGWIDRRLSDADPGAAHSNRANRMRAALLDPLTAIAGTGPKVWSMIMAELLLAGDPKRERWVTTGHSFIAIDSLVHAYLDRTGVLVRLGLEHPYGQACHGAGGCTDVISGLAQRIDARQFNASYPRCFPRWIQFAVWSFCAAGGRGICAGTMIDDRVGCTQRFCPSYAACDRRARLASETDHLETERG